MKSIAQLILLIPFLIAVPAFAQMGHPDSLRNYQVRASQTDPNISFELVQHQLWFNPDAPTKNELLVYMSGTFDNPNQTTLFPSLAANLGYHVLSLKYPNGKSAQSACKNSSDTSCFSKFRQEIITGSDLSSEIEVDTNDCILNRLSKLLKYLGQTQAQENWDTFYTGSKLNWDKFTLAGHSQGGGHAAIMAKDYKVKRVIMFASPNDYSSFYKKPANWTSDPSQTPALNYFAFGNQFDDIADFGEQKEQWAKIGLPAYGDTINVRSAKGPFKGSHQLYTDENTQGLSGNHNNMVRDDETAMVNGKPIYEEAWMYLLGVPFVPGSTSQSKIPKPLVYPNPASGMVHFRFTNSKLKELSILNLNGKSILPSVVSNDIELNIEISSLASGIYIYQTKQWTGSSFGTLVVE